MYWLLKCILANYDVIKDNCLIIKFVKFSQVFNFLSKQNILHIILHFLANTFIYYEKKPVVVHTSAVGRQN